MSAATLHPASAQRPWIGLKSFSEDDREFFAGRSEEIDELLRLVRRDTLTLLYGVSGLGKTSLVRAGLFPALRKEDCLPVPIRLDYLEGAPPLAAQVLGAIAAAASAAGVEAPKPREHETLWEYFHRESNHFWSARNELVTPFLVFDQFEEAFTLGRETPVRARRASQFIAELADLVENRPTEALRDDPQRAGDFSFKPALLKVLLAMREDYLAELDRIRSQFRALGQNRLRLLPMGEGQAHRVINLGAPLLAPGVADRIVTFTAGGAAPTHGSEVAVAPALLSLVLRELNERRLARGPDAKITPDLLAVEQQKILEDFYLRTLEDFPAGVRNFIEDELLTATGYRNSCALDDALASEDVTQPILDELVNRRLLAYEDSHRVRRVEITHDVLAPVIKTSRDNRVTREALAEAERKEAEAREKAGVVQRVQTTLLAFVVLLGSALLLLSVFVGPRPEHGSRWLNTIYKELQKEPPASPDSERINEARRELQLLAKGSKATSKDFYGNARLYSDMSQLAETLAKENKLGPKDKLLANIFETLDDQHLGPQGTLNGATKTLKTLTENQQANIAGFAIDNYRREHDKRSVLLQVIAIIAVFVVAPIWITRRFLGREPMTKWLRRKRTNERKIEKRPNPFLRIAAKLGDLLVASLLGLFVGIVFGQLSGIVHLWVTGEISDTTWGVNTTINLFALMLSSGIYLLFCDAIKYTHRRSFGKIMCRLIPITCPQGGPVTIGVSAKRNGPFALSFMLVIPCAIMANSTAYPMPDFVREQNDILNGLIDVGAVIFVILSLEEFTLAWIKDGRTLLDRFAKTKVIREP
jgi:regulator of protease activity HflC (stomatin/prohibitin superfamily)